MVEKCFRCRVDEDHALLFETITPTGVKKVCRKCSFEIDTPIIETNKEIKETGRRSVYERLSGAAGLDARRHRERIMAIDRERKRLNQGQDTDLKELVRKNLREVNEPKPEKYVDNFNWVIMMARRSKKITREELARGVGESEEAIRMLEDKRLPKGDETIVKKIENYLGIKLFRINSHRMGVATDEYKRELLHKIEKAPDKILFDRKNPEQLTIGALKEIKEEKFKPNPRVFLGNVPTKVMIRGEEVRNVKDDIRNQPEFVEDEIWKRGQDIEEKRKSLTEEEIDDLLFGGKKVRRE